MTGKQGGFDKDQSRVVMENMSCDCSQTQWLDPSDDAKRRRRRPNLLDVGQILERGHLEFQENSAVGNSNLARCQQMTGTQTKRPGKQDIASE